MKLGSYRDGDEAEHRSGRSIVIDPDSLRPGARIRCAAWTGVIVFTNTLRAYSDGYTESDWSYFGRGFMVDYDQAGLVFEREPNEDHSLESDHPEV